MALIGHPIVVGYNNAGQGQGYGSCTTSTVSQAAKAVTLANYNLQVGGIVAVKFPYNNTATSITLNINNKGPKPVMYRGSATIDATLINAGDIATFIYDGTNYHLISVDRWGNSPNFKGTPTAPTATTATDTEQIATTEFVHNAIEAGAGEMAYSSSTAYSSNTVGSELSSLKGSLTSLNNRINTPQQDSVTTLAAAVSALASASVGVFSGKSAVGSALIGINESCFIVAKYIASSNTALYFASSASAAAFGSFSTANYTVNIYETTVNTTGTATDVYTGADCVVKKSWNNVQISLVGDSTERTFDSYGWKTLATLPSGYRPSSAIQGFPVRMVDSSGKNLFRTGRITSGGVLSVYMSSEDVNVPLKGIMVFTTFII